VVDEVGTETEYDVFREKLIAKKESNGKDRPSYAIYDVEFELEGGEGKRYARGNVKQLEKWMLIKCADPRLRSSPTSTRMQPVSRYVDCTRSMAATDLCSRAWSTPVPARL
jgi:hypothetical protein